MSTESRLRRIVRSGYGRRLWAETGYVLVAFPVACFSFCYLMAALYAGALLLVTFIGLPLLAGALLGARQIARLDRTLARKLLGLRVEAPGPPRRGEGVLQRIWFRLKDLAAWRAMAYFLLGFPARLIALVVAAAFWGYGLLMVASPAIWQFADPINVDENGQPRHSIVQFNEYYVDTWPRVLMIAATGVLILLVAPWAVRLALLPDKLLIRGLLGATSLTERVRDLEATRALAVDTSAAQLRRIERDLHDGAQAQLVALAMNLGMISEELESTDDASLDRARTLAASAHRTAKDALTDLREVARSIHPPVLDSGLDPALATLASRSPVPVDLRVDLPERPSPAIETIAYFCVAELLTNVAKHSRATSASVRLHRADGGIRIQVSDDGVGGAVVGGGELNGGGLSGLADRIEPVDGQLTVFSPPGGPTLVTIDLPAHS